MDHHSSRPMGGRLSMRSGEWAGLCGLLLALSFLSGCRSLGREVNQALPEFLRSDPGAEEIERFEQRRRVANRTPEELSRAQTDFEEAKAYFATEEWEQAKTALELFLESYPDTPNDKEARLLLVKADLKADEYSDARKQWTDYVKFYPVSEFGEEVERIGFEMAMSYVRGEQDFLFFSESFEGIKILKEIGANFPGGVFADDSYWEAGQYFFEEDNDWIEAATSYRMIVDKYPDSPWAARAHYNLALSLLNRVKGAEYDQKLIGETIKEFEAYLTKHPEGDRRDEAATHIKELTSMLAEKHVLIADWYIGQDMPRAARFYLLRAMKLYPGTPEAAEAERLLATLPPEEAGLPPIDPATLPKPPESAPTTQESK